MASAAPQRHKSSRLGTEPRRRRGFSRLTSPLGPPLTEGRSSPTILRRDAIYRRALALADCVAALAALACVLLGLTAAQARHLPPWSLAVVFAVVVIAKLLGLYDRDELLLRKSTLDESSAVFQLATIFTLLVALCDRQVWNVSLLPRELLALWGLTFCLMLVARWLARHVARVAAPPERCLVVGDEVAMEAIESRLHLGRNVNAILVGHHPLRADYDDAQWAKRLERRLHDDDVHRVIVAPAVSDSDVVLDVVRVVKNLGVKVSLLPRLFEVVGSSVVFDDIAGITVLGIRRFGLSRSSALIKRAMDLLGAAIGLIAVAPIMAAIALAIKLDSRGPVFFRQTRMGRDGRPFEMLKFRSMVRDADAMRPDLVARAGNANELFKLASDPRLTRVGRALRHASLDELPQLFNVLRGDMSLVGPRPLILTEDALVQGWQRRRLQLWPGMTGPWQILGSTRVPLNEMAKMDYLYIANWSLFSDVKIILRTVLHMAGRSGM
jgi:exopolysaccharide biosynthesis polyprenyl glycosylphosphotransferase